MNNKKALAILLSLSLSFSVFSGCALLQFEDPEELKQQEQEMQERETVEVIKPDKVLIDDRLVMDESLTDDAGKELAWYRASFPYFDEGDNQALANINEYYESEFSHLADDKDRFFKLVQEQPSDKVRASLFTYKILASDETYFTVLRCFESSNTLGKTSMTYYCEVFSAATGWKLKFSDVFGNQSEKALELIRGGIEQWCKDKGYETNWVFNSEDEVFTDNFTFSTDTLYIGLPSHTSPGGETLIELELDEINELIMRK